MNKFQKGIIYKIVSSQTAKIYVGSTIQKIYDRMGGHKRGYRENRTCTSKLIMCYDDAHIVLIENYPCNTEKELLLRERYFFEKYKSEGIELVNKKSPIVSFSTEVILPTPCFG